MESSGRAGGVYIPPFKLARMQRNLKDPNSTEYQKMMWELLRKSINGIINKANISNLSSIIYELFNENLLRGKGLLVRSLLKGQTTAPNFTHVYAALVAVVNTKLPEIGRLLVARVILQFQKAYRRNEKLVCRATTKMIAHLVNQQVVHELIALQLAALLLQHATEDSIEIACDFMIECGQVLSDLCPTGVHAIFEKFRSILQEGETSKRVQYTIEELMKVRRNKFKDNPGVLQELDLVEEDDKITHEIALDDELDPQEELDVFNYDEDYEKHEQEWEEIKKEILGEEEQSEEEVEESEEEENLIKDMTDRDYINLRKTIYLIIMSSVSFEECANKLMKLRIREGQEAEIAMMLVEVCLHERTYLRFFGLLAQRFCLVNPDFQEHFQEAFAHYYKTVHRLETNQLRNIAKFFSHLLFTDSISWAVFRSIVLTEEDTTSSSRIFIKILMQEVSENIGTDKLKEKLSNKELQDCFKGLFPTDTLKHTRFAINFFTSIDLGPLTDELRQLYEQMEEEESESSSSESSEEEQLKNQEAAQRFMQKELVEKPRKRSRSR